MKTRGRRRQNDQNDSEESSSDSEIESPRKRQRRQSGKKSRVVSDDSSDSANDTESRHGATPNHTQSQSSSRSSERIRRRQNQEFHMPSRRAVFEDISEPSTPGTRQVRRRLASSFTRETHSYNQDRLSDISGSSVEDFIVGDDEDVEQESESSSSSSSSKDLTDVYRRSINERYQERQDEEEEIQVEQQRRHRHRQRYRRLMDSSTSDESTNEKESGSDAESVTVTTSQEMKVNSVPYGDEDDSVYGLQEEAPSHGDTCTKPPGGPHSTSTPHKVSHQTTTHLTQQGTPALTTNRDESDDSIVFVQTSEDEASSVRQNHVSSQTEQNQLVPHQDTDTVSSVGEPKTTHTSFQATQQTAVSDSDDELLANISLQPECMETQNEQPVSSSNKPMGDPQVMSLGKPSGGSTSGAKPQTSRRNRSMVIESDSDESGVSNGGEKSSIMQTPTTLTQTAAVAPPSVDSESEDEGQIKSQNIKGKGKRSFVFDSEESDNSATTDNLPQVLNDDSGCDSNESDDSQDTAQRTKGLSHRASTMKMRKDKWRAKFENYKKARKK